MEELNVYSYLQKSSSFYNLLKSERKIFEELPKKLRFAQKKKINKEVEKEVERCIEILKERSIFESPPRHTLKLLKLLKELKNQLKKQNGNLRKFATKLEKEQRVLSEVFCLEFVAKLVKCLHQDYPLLIKEAYTHLGYRVKTVSLSLIDRGLFGASQGFAKFLFEVGMEFDPYLNVPVLPASSIKGAMKNAYEMIKKDEWPPIDEVFGNQEKAGAIIFTDGYPVKAGRKGFVLYPDVLTPHYPEDALGELNREPKPISHLCVAPETHFKFLIAYKKEVLKKEMLEQTIKLAIDLGIGARTSVGYGRFVLEGIE